MPIMSRMPAGIKVGEFCASSKIFDADSFPKSNVVLDLGVEALMVA